MLTVDQLVRAIRMEQACGSRHERPASIPEAVRDEADTQPMHLIDWEMVTTDGADPDSRAPWPTANTTIVYFVNGAPESEVWVETDEDGAEESLTPAIARRMAAALLVWADSAEAKEPAFPAGDPSEEV